MGTLSFLVIEDNTHVQRALFALLRPYGRCQGAPSVKSAKPLLTEPWDGLLIDVRLEDGSGLDVLKTARKKHVKSPAVVLTGLIDHETVNRAALLDARLVSKPCGMPELAAFISDACLFNTGDRIKAAVERARHRWTLTDRETIIIAGALRGRTRGDNLEEMGITQNTYKTHVRKLLDKADYTSLSSLAIDLLAER